MELSGHKDIRDLTPGQFGGAFEKYLQEHLESVLNGMPVPVSWATLEDTRINFLNKKFTEVFGYTLGDHETVMDWIRETYVNEKHVERATALWSPHLQSDAVSPIEIKQIELDILCKNGEVKTCLVGGTILPREGWALATFTDISDRKKYELEIKKLALEDDLTKLANRRGFNKMLKAILSYSRRYQNKVALLMIDVDDFKKLNDTLGHDVGDEALQTIARVICRNTRSEDYSSRLGGDEFAILINEVQDIQDVTDVAERILQGAAKPVQINEATISMKLSIGIAMFPEDGSDPSTLMKSADQALYRAKAKGKGNWSH